MTESARPSRRTVFLHIGSPKTGTTYLQNILWNNRHLARSQGLLLPGRGFGAHFHATVDVRGLAARPQHSQAVIGAWERLVHEAERWPGRSLISHELFAGATNEQAAEAIATFSPHTDVHLVLTVRDYLRQIPAEWQEHVKHRAVISLPDFVEKISSDKAGKTWFWRVQDYARLVERWGATLPPERIHVVTVPPKGAPPLTLWTRFATLLGLDASSFDTDTAQGNLSLRMEQVELLRRVNEELGEELSAPGVYPRVVKEIFAQELLANRPGTPIRLDTGGQELALRRSEEVAQRLKELDVDVIGDLAELLPDEEITDTDFVAVPDEHLLAEAIASIRLLLHKVSERPAVEREFRRQLDWLQQRPIRFALSQASERHPALERVRSAYRRGVEAGRRWGDHSPG